MTTVLTDFNGSDCLGINANSSFSWNENNCYYNTSDL